MVYRSLNEGNLEILTEITILADIGDICDFRFVTFDIEPSDEHPMG